MREHIWWFRDGHSKLAVQPHRVQLPSDGRHDGQKHSNLLATDEREFASQKCCPFWHHNFAGEFKIGVLNVLLFFDGFKLYLQFF